MGVPGVVWTACMPASRGGCTGRRKTRALGPTDSVQRGPPCPCDTPDWQEYSGSVCNLICAAKPRVRPGCVIPLVVILLAVHEARATLGGGGLLCIDKADVHVAVL